MALPSLPTTPAGPARVEQQGNAPELRELIPDAAHPARFSSFWSNPESMCAHIETLGEGNRNWHDGAWSYGAGFTGTTSMREAIALCRAGWPDGAERAARLRDHINAANPTGPRLVKWDVAGAFPNVSRALAGNPLNMRRIDSARLRRRPVLTLLSNMGCKGSTTSDALSNRAAVVAAVVDAIEAKGFSCHVVVFERSSGNGVAQTVAATVKESDAAADIGRLAFGLGHASMFRRLSWAVFTATRFTEPLGDDLGVAESLNLAECNARGAYVLHSPDSNESAFADEDSAATTGLAYLIAALRKQGCPAFPQDETQAA